MNTDPTLVNLNLRLVSFDQLFDEAGDGTLADWLTAQRAERERQNREIMHEALDGETTYPDSLHQATRAAYVQQVSDLPSGEQERLAYGDHPLEPEKDAVGMLYGQCRMTGPGAKLPKVIGRKKEGASK